jgi:hypothetical protein
MNPTGIVGGNTIPGIFKYGKLAIAISALVLCSVIGFAAESRPKAPGKLVDLGGHRLHLNCYW